jgi:DNA helicase II / ATP-dependent DNA helicase PcrA
MIGSTTVHLRELNPEQREAVEHLEGPLLVLAGAGSGKTRVLTVRIARLIEEHGVPPDRILAVTFTNKAAGEMKDRIRALLGRDPAGAWVGTFHSLGARLLRRHADRLGWDATFTIFDAEESLREIKRVMEALQIDPKRWRPQAVRSMLGEVKNQLVTPEEFAEQHGDGFDLLTRNVAKIYPAYQKSLREQNAFDFDDLLVKPVELLRNETGILERYQERFAFLLVDEYQDTNHAQFRFVELLARKHRNLMVVGDDDQSIYRWRGADIRNILDFEGTYRGARVVRLERNYRSTSTILEAANRVIRRNRDRKEKTLRTDREAGERVTLTETADERDEANWILDEIEARIQDGGHAGFRDFTVLYRTNAQSRALEDAFRRRGVPYQIVGGVRFYERREIQDVLAYLRLISNPLDRAAFDRVVNTPRRGVGDATRKRLGAWADGEGITLLEAAARADEAPGLPGGGVQGLQRFAGLIRDFSVRAASHSVGPLLEDLVEDLDFLTHLRDEGPEGDDRAENVKELIAGALDFEARMAEEWDEAPPDYFTELDLFLQHVALITDIDRHDGESDVVTFMTLHNAKGLEFPVVFISGLEEGLFPLGRAYEEPAQLEEERRLFYVGITRAKDKLYLSWARERRRAGDFTFGTLSSFVKDIPEGLLEERRSAHLARERASFESDRRGFRGGQAGGFRHRGETEYDDDLNQDRPQLVRGERVTHPTFGSGTVVEVSGFGRDVRIAVDFDSVGRKKLLARYAGLEKEF